MPPPTPARQGLATDPQASHGRPVVAARLGGARLGALLLCVALATAAHAADSSPASALQAPAVKASHSRPASAPAKALDTLDQLRDKLSQRISATQAVDRKNVLVMQTSAPAGNDLRVSAKPAPASSKMLAPPRVARSSAAMPGAMPGRMSSTKPSHGTTAHGPAAWTYDGDTGPQAWATMHPDFALCGRGTRQSPIDIQDGIAVDLEPVQFDYRASSFSVIDTGHTVQVNLAPGNAIEVLGRRYELLQFHFHRPSEERIGGRQFDMVVHLLHQDAEGRMAMVAVLLDRGSVQPIVQTVWNNLPLEKGEVQTARVTIDMNALLPKDRRYYTYMGSLTSPPCTEGVLWMVMKEPVTVSPEQIDIFAKLYPMNARPVQNTAGRLIKQSN